MTLQYLGTTAKQVAMVWACAADNVWLKKCMECEVEGTWPRDRPKKTWIETVEKDCQARKLNKDDAMDCKRWWMQIRND